MACITPRCRRLYACIDNAGPDEVRQDKSFVLGSDFFFVMLLYLQGTGGEDHRPFFSFVSTQHQNVR